jgi:flagellar biosynthesis component FlhA
VCYTKEEGKVYNAKRRNVIYVCKSPNRNVLRRLVRRKLIELGVLLEKEFTEKGYAKKPKL